MSDFSTRFPSCEIFTAYLEENFNLYPISWRTGGMQGGNCWGDNADSLIEPDTEPEMTVLDEILVDVYPFLSFMQYRTINTNVVVITRHIDSEWYGNYTDYKRKTIDPAALFNALSAL